MTDTHEQWDIVSSVGLTALGVAAARAVETNRADPLVRDPYAADLVHAANPPSPMPTEMPVEGEEHAQMWAYMADRMGARTLFLDEFLEKSVNEGVTQAVILASGLDTRAFRMSWPAGFRIFEVDQPLVLDFKEQVLSGLGAEPSCSWHQVRIDLRDDWAGALTDAGFDPGRPTAWLAEGLLSYLPAEAQQRLLEIVSEFSAPGSTIGLTANTNSIQNTHAMQLAERHLGVNPRELLHSDERPEPAVTLTGLGWSTTKSSVSEVGHHYDRPLEKHGDESLQSSHFITARK